MTCTGVRRIWNSRVGILGARRGRADVGLHEVPAGEASVGQAVGRPGRRAAG